MVDVLMKEHEEFKSKNSNYLTDISINNEVILQLTHPFNLYGIPELKSTKFGYAVFLTFPDSVDLHNKFQQSRFFSLFIKEKNNPEGIPCYAYVSSSELEVCEIISDFLINTYGYNANDTFGMGANYQGEIL